VYCKFEFISTVASYSLLLPAAAIMLKDCYRLDYLLRRIVFPVLVLLLFSLLLIEDVGGYSSSTVTEATDPIINHQLRNNQQSHNNSNNNNSNEQQQQQQQRNLEEEEEQDNNNVIEYKLWESSKISEVLDEWKKKYPNLIQVTTSQEAYGLPTAGNEEDCPFYKESDGCPNYFFTLQDFTAHPIDSISSSYLPEVFLSGCLHGNERVGPTSVMEATSLLLESAHCEGLPRRSSLSLSASSLDLELKEAKECRQTLKNKGIDDVHRKWLARLITTRRIVVAPTTNGKI
jgi:hypothetical protein